MPDISNSLRNRVLPRLGQEPSNGLGFRDWLRNGAYFPQEHHAGKEVSLQRVRLVELIRFLSYDFERFALSSRETFTVATIENEEHGIVSWPSLKLYYSAFFGSHAIMRSMGAGVVFLQSKDVAALNSMLQVHDPAATILPSGAYVYRVIPTMVGSPDTVSVTLRLDTTSKGVHDGFWKSFCAYLNERSTIAMTNAEADAGDFLSGAETIINAVSESGLGSSSWLSKTRNAINYSHDFNAWFPVPNRSEARTALAGIRAMPADSVRVDISRSRKPVTALCQVSTFLACLSLEVSEHLAARSTKAKAFGQRWRQLGQLL